MSSAPIILKGFHNYEDENRNYDEQRRFVIQAEKETGANRLTGMHELYVAPGLDLVSDEQANQA